MARDVTEDFNRAASCMALQSSSSNRQSTYVIAALRTGQLVQDEFFTLFEAVGALEVRAQVKGGRTFAEG